MRSDSHLKISAAGTGIKILKLITGKIFSVFDKDGRKIILPTASIGIRGTAIDAEADPLRLYLCTCYGCVDIQADSNPAVRETGMSKRHNAPRYICASGEKLIVKAQVINHTDDELLMLEALVGRVPVIVGMASMKEVAATE